MFTAHSLIKKIGKKRKLLDKKSSFFISFQDVLNKYLSMYLQMAIYDIQWTHQVKLKGS